MRTITISALVTLAALAVAGVSAGPAAAASARPGRQAVIGDAVIAGSTISCGSARACLAVGLDESASGAVTPTAEAWNGTRWRSVAVPAPKHAVDTAVTAVSCRSASSCLVVGYYDTAGENGGELPYALTWNGASLRATAAVPAPKGYDLVSFNDVACVTAKACVAVGSLLADGISEGTPPLLVETWNGATWTERTTRSVPGAAFADLNALSCLSLTWCVVAGEAYSDDGAQSMLLARWNGKSLSAMKAAAPAGAKDLALDGISCTARTSCAAAGFSLNSAGTSGFGFAETWNGRSWAAHKVAVPKGDTLSYLFGVSCATARSCIAVGANGSAKGGVASALSYNGKTWSTLKVPSPAKGKSSAFSAVSCPTAGDCVAIGEIGRSGGSTATQLAGLWNGFSWRLVAA